MDTQPKNPELPPLKSDDMQYFDKLLMDIDESTLTKEERNEREIMESLLKIKNGTPPMRKSGLRTVGGSTASFSGFDEVVITSDHSKCEKIWRRPSVQPDSASAHVSFSRRPGTTLDG